MNSITLKSTIVVSALLWAVSGPQPATASTITDGFEGNSISALWTQSGPGDVTLTGSAAYAGTQSVELAASSAFPWDADLTHDFGSEQYGTVSVYVQTGLLCCGSAAAIQIDDASDHNVATFQRVSTDGFEARAFGGSGETDSAVFAGDGGWDQLDIVATAAGLAFVLDGTTVFTDAADTSGFRYVDLQVWGGPGGSEFFDNFSATTSSVAPEPSTFVLFGGVGAVALVWRRRRLRANAVRGARGNRPGACSGRACAVTVRPAGGRRPMGVAILAALFCLAFGGAPLASASVFGDGFELTSLSSPFWAKTGPGAAAISTSIAHSGARSLKLATSSTYPWNATVEHTFAAEQSGSASVYVYSQLCCGVSADIQLTRANGDWANIQQLPTGGYQARVSVGGAQSVQFTGVGSPGWNLFEIQADSNGVAVKLNGVTVLADPRITSFLTLSLDVWGGPSGPAAYYA